MPTTSPITGASFFRHRAARTVSGIATAGVMVGISLAGASSASAATDADCDGSNTVDATAAGTALDIQTLMDDSTPVICLSGTFVLASSLDFGYDLTIHGLTDAVLDGDGVTGILYDDSDDTLTVENLTFRNGFGGDGGAINGVTVIVNNSQFFNNQGYVGGAIYAADVDIYDSNFSGNVAGLFGGAVAADNSVIATRTTFVNNSVEQIGGAIFSYGLASSIESTFEGNTAVFGGAITAYGVLTSIASTFEDNTAQVGGAIFALDDGGPEVESSIDVQNSTFVGNSVEAGEIAGPDSRGAAIFATAGSVRQSTFLNTEGSAVLTAYQGIVELRGNIFSGSSAPAEVGVENGGTAVDLGANVFTTAEADEAGLGSVQPTTKFGVTAAALFAGATLADNGGPTQTVALHAGSPALSVVPADASSMTVDQRGVARPAVSDAGAYEFDNADADGGAAGSGDGAELAATGSEPAPWLVGTAALLLVGGVTVLGLVRRKARRLR